MEEKEEIIKVGDKVERINSNHGDIRIGDIKIVTRIEKGDIYFGDNYAYATKNFKLISRKNLVESIEIW